MIVVPSNFMFHMFYTAVVLAFTQGEYNEVEDNEVQIQLFSQLSLFRSFNGTIKVDVEVVPQGDRGCTRKLETMEIMLYVHEVCCCWYIISAISIVCSPAAGEDFTLPSSNHTNIATVAFVSREDDSSTFTIKLRCDDVLEGPEFCTLRVANISIPENAPVSVGNSRPFVTLRIDNCEREGNFRCWVLV